MHLRLIASLTLAGLLTAGAAPPQEKKKIGKRPPVNITYHVSALGDAPEREALRAALLKVKTVSGVVLGAGGAWVFDSHVVSYHQVAQAIADAGTAAGKKYSPRLKLHVPEYAQKDNAAKVDAIFAGKRLNQRVRIEPVD